MPLRGKRRAPAKQTTPPQELLPSLEASVTYCCGWYAFGCAKKEWELVHATVLIKANLYLVVLVRGGVVDALNGTPRR
ncbi:uncharacterized protein SETTUDRAFT_154851 [Exserohilum turcica Et28A]|uniref:Uncharacterized protein n=1 Tax=Exserohilum turcicum (strain 28A) TaxID=671987 RepID=R0K6V8_EXST2|nr:uncharacterized protein SETTUDRAFT_154851 [Exserohilum turcica Et28A]EOA85279.1 hypothetical protein SETTUDRAFT_154851 [Exserohilum turcica Et28A]